MPLPSHPQDIWPFLCVDPNCFCCGDVGVAPEKRGFHSRGHLGEVKGRAEIGSVAPGILCVKGGDGWGDGKDAVRL